MALGIVGVCAIVDGAFPLSCAESLDASCKLSYDALDIVHGAESFASIVFTIAAFWLIGTGLRREPGWGSLGGWTLGLGAVWVLLNIAMGGKFFIDELDEVKGAFQRASQVVLGGWLVALALEVARGRGTSSS